MKCSIKNGIDKSVVRKIFEEGCEQAILSRLPEDIDLDRTARQAKALIRKREVKRGFDLLRMVLVYAACDWSLRMVGMWCAIMGIGVLSDVAVLKRLRRCREWLGKLVLATLQSQQLAMIQRPGLRLRIMDGTSLSQPGSQGTDWRIHISFDVEACCVDGIELSDAKTGETFAHFPTRAGEIRVGDRGYAYAKSMGPALKAHGFLVVRINWRNLPLADENGRKIDLIGFLRKEIGEQTLTELKVWLTAEEVRFGMRLIVAKLPQEAADKARACLRRKDRKKGVPLSQEALLAAGFILILSNLPAEQWTTKDILKLYRVRWQIELVIKRLKSLLHVDHIRSQCPELTQVYLLSKLLVALMIDKLVQKVQAHHPEWFLDTKRPISLWRLTTLLFEIIATHLRGLITLTRVLSVLPLLKRFLCDPPRRRTQQLAQARQLLSKFASQTQA